jgi:membrane protein DedA with SNARE-associated domain
MKRKPTKQEALIGGISITVTIVLCILIIQHRSYLDQIAHWGYVGCFFINILASGTLVMPGFGMILTFTLGGVLNPAIVGAVAGIAEAIGAVGAYFTGYGGGGLFRDNNSGLYLRFSNIIDRHGSKAVFFMASIINPIYYPFAVFLGMLRFGLARFLLATWAGRTIKNMMLAYLGYFGLRSILQWLGLSF